MAFKTITTEISDNILTITMNRPDHLNAMTIEQIDEMIVAFDIADNDDNVRVVIVTGAGRAFCAGADLSAGPSAFDRRTNAEQEPPPLQPSGEVVWSDERVRDAGGRLTLRIFECLKPVIAAVNGPAVGVGITMQLAMDVRIASEKARFGFVFARRGVVPEAASTWFLPRIVGVSQALEWFYSGRVFPAEEALRGRLISRIVPADELIPTARAVAREIIDNTAPVSIALIRQMTWRLLGADHPMEGHRLDSRAMYARGLSVDMQEGVNSFLEKRPAKFTDKVSRNLPSFFPWWKKRNYD
ncbi:crotonase/enoyl-CoA hydratase family protein [Bradyrhizobium sp. AS23.2]|uniref:crotonase/enoyl-CoA hydratase family protein n=1 Tax=Bradyrhizobium sp. AS23.2 TaxID=1680155 RepID=UPI00093FF830|nr:crotonase/enoyl-CoA hydratase family protein [Bradyrhizobium sp. AS23.2]OKO81098.1 enoyl-CoA hydratase [Bradyrhizobium sp. AS23.2]